MANERSKAPMKASLHQRIGSVTKTFIGALLMQLAGDHKLSLSDKVSKYIEGVPNGDAMTLREVADMTSGVASYTADPAFVQALYSDPTRRWRPAQLLDVGLRDSPLFTPGTSFQYSDSNYVLLGQVIRQVMGKPMRAVLRKRIFDPLNLAQTSWPGGSADLPTPHARGYTLQGRPVRPAGQLDEVEPVVCVGGRRDDLDRRRPARLRARPRNGQGTVRRLHSWTSAAT